MKSLFGKDWCLTENQKKALIKLYTLTEAEQEDFFPNIEYQIQNLPQPVRNKPVDKEVLESVKRKAGQLRDVIGQLDDYHKNQVSNSIQGSTQTLVQLTQSKITDTETGSYEEITTRNILNLDRGTDLETTLNAFNSKEKHIDIPEHRFGLARLGEIDANIEKESIVKQTFLLEKEWPHYKNIENTKLSSNERKDHSLSKTKVMCLTDIDPTLMLQAIEDEIASLLDHYSDFNKSDLITDSLATAFGCISTYDGETGQPTKPNRKISPSVDGRFVQYLTIVLQGSVLDEESKDLAQKLSKSIQRSNWYEQHDKWLRTKGLK